MEYVVSHVLHLCHETQKYILLSTLLFLRLWLATIPSPHTVCDHTLVSLLLSVSRSVSLQCCQCRLWRGSLHSPFGIQNTFYLVSLHSVLSFSNPFSTLHPRNCFKFKSNIKPIALRIKFCNFSLDLLGPAYLCRLLSSPHQPCSPYPSCIAHLPVPWSFPALFCLWAFTCVPLPTTPFCLPNFFIHFRSLFK